MSEIFLPDPLQQLQRWYEEAVRKPEPHPDAMTLATADKNGRPSARIVLYKGIDQGGILIFTNYQSRKAIEMAENPHAALVFYWPGMYRQVRIEGEVKRISVEESARYFASRPYESQISAWISEQSQVIPDREYLQVRYEKYHQKFPTGKVRCPEFWGGFRLVPERMEFWIGRDHRLHDRFCYRKRDEQWEIVRLAP
jgi:pyridoxamine 5'-phosphate oxidase